MPSQYFYQAVRLGINHELLQEHRWDEVGEDTIEYLNQAISMGVSPELAMANVSGLKGFTTTYP